MATLRFVSGTAVAALGLWLLACLSARAEQRTLTAEDDIKAAFLFNFTKYVEWPADPGRDAFRVCVVAEPAFGVAVDRTIAGESLLGQPMVRLTPATPDAARGCQILFVGRLEDRPERWITAVQKVPVLVVSESRAGWERGAHINFSIDDNKVRFDINEEVASSAGLSISSKLLRLAQHVRTRQPR